MPIQIKAAIGAALLAAAFWAGWSANGWRLGEKMQGIRADLAEARENQQKAARARERADDAALDAVVDAAYTRAHERQKRTETVIKEVVRYEQSDPVPCRGPEWIRLYNESLPGGGMPREAQPAD